ncbi:MAG: serine/threonine protein kinase, partial [Gemmatimonadota bacterium]|nr:serine/threonine protein kinase [Gemmatimonadota bacterium]
MDAALRAALQASLGTGYRLDRELGGGGMSQVILATDLTLDRQVVVKVLPPDLSAAASVDRFRREIQLVAKLQHPHVVPIVTAGDAAGTLYYVMPFLAGESLRARMAREGPLKVGDTVRILREVLDALAFAHAHGVIHRDMKPENILLSASHAVVADFGVSKALQDSGAMTSVGMTVGTPSYMAPEQAAADPATDHRADLYAMGIVAYEMLSGAPPFTGTPSQVIAAHFSQAPAPLKTRRSDVPDALAEMIMRALAKDAAERPQSAEEMIAVLDAVVTPAGGETTATPAVTTASGPRVQRSATTRGTATDGATAVIAGNRRLAVTVGVLIAAGIAFGAWYALRPNVMASAQSIAITPFSVADGDTALVRLGRNLVTTMSANLDGVGDIHVADPISVLSHARSSEGLLSLDGALEIARTMRARSAVVGTLTRLGAMVRAELSMYELTSPAVPLVRVSATLPVDSIGALSDSLAWGLLRAVWAKGRAPTINASSIDTRSPAALREFLDGEQFFARGGFPEASAAYERAIAIDTTFWFAHFRYIVARNWTSAPVDTGIMNRAVRHLSELPERERLLAEAYTRSTTVSDQLRRFRELNAKFPDYPPGLLALGDLLLHFAPRAGADVRESVEPFKRLVQLMPTDFPSAEHLAITCLVSSDLPCATTAVAHYDSLVRADTAPLLPLLQLQRGPG